MEILGIVMGMMMMMYKPRQYRAITTVRRRMFMIITLGVLDLVDFCFNVSLIKFQLIKTTQNQTSGLPIAIF